MDRAAFSFDRMILAAVFLIPVLYIFARILPVTFRNKRTYRKLLKEGVLVNAVIVSVRRDKRSETEAEPVVETRTFTKPFVVMKFVWNGVEYIIEHEYLGNSRKLSTAPFAPGATRGLRILSSSPNEIFYCEALGGFRGESIPFLKDRLVLSNPVHMDRLARLLAIIFITLFLSLPFLDT